MATILLTAVGTALGGPIGGALGALAGQAIDSRLLGSGNRREGPRLTELAVQTSSYGARVPAIFGRMRIAGTVIWATDLRESQEEVGGGKGRAGVTQYSYSVSLAVALSSRPILAIGRIWADGKLLRGAAADFKSACTFRLHRGHGDQSPDPLIAAAEGEGMAPAHRGLAYAMFEDLQLADYGNHIPSLSFEVIERDGPVRIADIARALGVTVEPGAGLPELTGYAVDADDARGAMATLLTLSPDEVTASGLDIIVSAPPDETGVGLEPLDRPELGRAPLSSLPSRLSLRHYDPAADYQAGLQQVEWPGGGRRAISLDWPAAIDAAGAGALAAAHLAASATRRETLSVDVAATDAPAAGAIISIIGIGGAWRVESIEHDRASARLSCRRHGGPGAMIAGVPDRTAVTAPDIVVPPTRLALVELPAMDGEPPHRPVIAIAATGEAGWRGAALEQVVGDGRMPLGSLRRRSVIGTLETPPAAATLPLWDEHHGLIADFGAFASLQDADGTALAAGANVAICGGEIFQFRRAAPLGAGRWSLSGLARGLFGTEDRAGGQLFGDPVVLLDRAALLFPDVPTLSSGMIFEIEAGGLGDEEPVTAALSVEGRALASPAPVHGRAERLSDGSVALSWIRRTRADRGWLDFVDAPLGEPDERFRVTLYAADSVALSAQDVTHNSHAVSPADLFAGATVAGIAQLGGDGVSPQLLISLTL